MSRATLLLSLFTLGCADYNLAKGSADAADTAAMEGDDYLDAQVLRFDVFPAASLGDGELLDQTFTFEASEVVLELSSPVTVRGTLTGYDAAPDADVSVPGVETRVVGYFQAFAPGTISSRKVATDEDGDFALRLLPRDDYTLAWIPESPAELPFLVISDARVSGPDDLSVYLDYAQPVYGQVTSGDGEPVEGVSVQAFDPATGVAGAVAITDHYGNYHLRLYPGDYSLHLSSDDEPLPTLEVGVTVPEEGGLSQDVRYGDLSAHAFRGQVLDRGGDPIENVLVRLTSVYLDDTPGGSVVLELDTPRNGIFSDDVVAGLYEVEYIPPFMQGDEAGLSPVLLAEPVEIQPGSNQLPAVALPERVLVEAVVVGPKGEPVVGALVRAQEVGFDNYVFQAVTDETGTFALRVSDTLLDWTVEPPVDLAAAVTFLSEEAFTVLERGQISLSEGRLVEGEVLWRGEPAPYAAVEVRGEDGRLYASTLSDERGRFSVRVAE